MSSSTQKSLAVLRIGLFLFMMVWALEKIVRPETFKSIFGSFYGFDAGYAVIYLIGAVQIAVLLLFVAGKFKTYTYGLVMAMNVVTLLVSYRQVLNPYEGGTNHLFAASIVVAAASIAIFLARSDDNLLVLKGVENTVEANQVDTEAPGA